VAALLKGDAEHVPPLHRRGRVVRVDLHDAVSALFLAPQNFKGLRRVAGGDDAVRHLALEIEGRLGVAYVRKGGPVAVGAQPVRAAGANIGAGDGGERRVRLHEKGAAVGLVQRQTHGGSGGGDMLEGRSRGQPDGGFQFTHQLPGVQRVQKIDVARPAVEYADGQSAAVPHEDAGRLLIGVAAVFQFQFVHFNPHSFLRMTVWWMMPST